MENAVDLIDLFYAMQINLEGSLEDVYNEISSSNGGDNVWLKLYVDSKAVLLDVRYSNEHDLSKNIKELDNSISRCKEIQSKISDPHTASYISKIIKLNSDIYSISQELLNNPQVSKEYLLYGPYYYYYNIKLVEKYNRYGNGFVGILNKLIESNNFNSLLKMEFPHYFKVIYPQRKEKKIEAISSKMTNIQSLPTELDGRKVLSASAGVIHADSSVLKLELFDNKIQDGDIVSINFNGDWIYNNISLETKT
ncbi:MAG: hypothetical protein R2771_00215 [Saprospiraceae bacterium]